MYSIEDTTISLTRGDTLCLNISLNKDGEPYTPSTNDRVYFAIKKNATDHAWLVLKEVIPDGNGELLLEIEPQDTKLLDFGTYRYDLSIEDENRRVYTFVVGDFIITEEVY